MVTFVTALITTSLLFLIVGIDMFLNKTTLVRSFQILFNTHIGLGRKYLIAAFLISFLTTFIIDFRRRKKA